MTTGRKIKAFVIGMGLGLFAYAVYLEFLTADESTATAIGWICFAPQFLVYWVASQFDLSETVGIVSSYAIMMLFYGYIALSVRLWTRTATWVFLVTVLLYLVLQHWIDYAKASDSRLLSTLIVFWPGMMLDPILTDGGISGRSSRILIECVSVALWYAALICGVRTIFMSFGKAKGNGASTASQDGNKIILRCPKCRQQLRLPASPSGMQVRCPSCRFQFTGSPLA
jgi:hypothetical protein